MTALKKEQRRYIFENYVTDCLRLLTESSAKQVGGRYITERFADILKKGQRQKNNRTGDEVAVDVITRLGLKLKGGS